jgi:predicted fused transcriptional regulator/phosphomethylpyrimidine kinase/predicted transcriptional regulator
MNQPCEIVVKKLLPLLRVLIAKELCQTYNWSQTRIANILGVTQAAVSNYLNQDESALLSQYFDLEEIKNIAKGLASEMSIRRGGHIDIIYGICRICLNLRKGGSICHAHKSKLPKLKDERCAICMQLHLSLSDVLEVRRKVINEVKIAVGMLEECQEFHLLLPEVYSNIVMAIEGAKVISDIAGIPGRIVRFRGKAKALMDPEFGVSGHLGKILLAVMRVNPKIRSAINIKYNKEILEILNKLNLKYYILKRDIFSKDVEEELIKFIEDLAKKNIKDIDAIIDEGSFGIEPNTYLFDENAIKLAEKVIRIARMFYNKNKKQSS